MLAITGINGMVGGAVCRGFESAGLPVVPMSTRPAGSSVVKLIDGCPQWRPGKQLSGLIHCGGLVGNGYSYRQYMDANVRDLQSLLNWVEDNEVQYFVYISTGGVYGPSDGWVDEETPVNPQGDYCLSKAMAEEAVASRHGIKTMIVRLYFPIGSFSTPHFFANVYRNLKRGTAFLNDADGHPWISPVGLDDAASSLAAAAGLGLSGVFNLSANTSITMAQVFSALSEGGEFPKVQSPSSPPAHTPGNYMGRADKLIKAAHLPSFEPVLNILRQRAAEAAKKGALPS